MSVLSVCIACSFVCAAKQVYMGLLQTYKLWINKLAMEMVEPLKAKLYRETFCNKFIRQNPDTRVGVVACVLGITV